MVVRVTQGDGSASVAAELVGSFQYQQIKVVGGETGSTSVMGVNPDRSINVSIIGSPNINLAGGSVIAVVTGTPSISGTVNIGTIPGSTVAFQGTVPWLIGSVYGNISGSVAAYQAGTWRTSIAGTPSISGTVRIEGADEPFDINGPVWGNVSEGDGPPMPPVTIGGVDPDGSVIGFRGTAAGALLVSATGSILAIPTANQSVSGTVGASIIGQLPAGTAPLGSVAALQGTNPWIVVGSVYGAGSVVSFQGGTLITSLVSTVPSSVIVGASIFGQLPAGTAPLGSVATLQGTNPWVVVGSVYGSGSVVSFQGGTQITSLVSTVPSSVIVGASIFGLAPVNVTNTNINVSGSVVAFQAGTRITSIVSTVPSSVIVGASIFGQLPAGTAPIGSVAVLQGTNPWAVTNVGSIISLNIGSIITTNVGSVIAIIQSSSIAGTYTEDVGFGLPTRGIFVLGQRNDTLASVTGADMRMTRFAVGGAGETVTANAPFTQWVRGTADLRGNAGGSVAVIAAQGSSIFTYVTGVQIANMGTASVLVTLSGATSSIIGYTIAPGGGGSNIVYPNALKTNANGAFTASISGQASVLVSAQGFTAKM